MLVELLVEEFAPRSVVERNDVRVRQLEGLPPRAGVLHGDEPGELEITQHGVRFREANVFDGLREREWAGEQFDTVILAPPAFAKNRASVGAAARGYKEIN